MNHRIRGLTIIGTLTVILITLKLTGVVEWSWFWIMAPIWIPIIVTGVVAFGYIILSPANE